MNRQSILVIDLSSSACTVHAFNEKGTVISKCKKTYKNYCYNDKWVELDPDEIWEVILSTIGSILTDKDQLNVAGIGITAQLGLVPVDQLGNACAPIMTWMDQRAEKQADAIKEKIGNDLVYKSTGRRISAELSAPKILWYKEERSPIYQNATKFLSLKDYIIAKFTGKLTTDPAHAGYSMLYNVEKQAWDLELIRELGIDVCKLPEVNQCHTIIGTVRREVAIESGLREGIPVSTGGPDGSMGTLGAGAVSPGSTVNVVGTTDVFFTCADRPVFDPHMRTIVNCHVVPGLWNIGGPMTTAGGCLQWFLNEFGFAEKEMAKKISGSEYEIFDREAASVSPGSDGLLFFTCLVGERAPNWDSNVRGSIIGLTPNTSRESVIRAIYEGSSYAVKRIIDIIEELGIEIKEVYMTGGGANSPIWQQIRADVTGKKYLVPKVNESTALGAFIAIAVGVGVFDDFDKAIEKLHVIDSCANPNQEINKAYQKVYENYKRAFGLLQQIYCPY
jgi:xylulokinase